MTTPNEQTQEKQVQELEKKVAKLETDREKLAQAVIDNALMARRQEVRAESFLRALQAIAEPATLPALNIDQVLQQICKE